jgi:anti-sigma-K factor RskA
MNTPSDPLDAFFAAGRAAKPDTSRLEHAFETRLLAKLAETPVSVWSSRWHAAALWKWLGGCAALTGFLFFWLTHSGVLDLHGEEPLWALWGGADASVQLFPN